MIKSFQHASSMLFIIQSKRVNYDKKKKHSELQLLTFNYLFEKNK
jgi:hypothetical protein